MIVVGLLAFGASSGSFSSNVVAQEVKKVVLRGQIACSNCWAEADRDKVPYGTPDDIQCAIDCNVKGYGGLLAVRQNDTTTLYQLEFGQTKRASWLDNIAKIVEVSGSTYQKNGKHYLKVANLTVLAENPVLAAAATNVGQKAPNITLTDLTGVTQSLQSYQGKIVVLNFWATWCAPCRAEMPEFISLQNANAAFGVQVIAASADEVGNRAAVIKFVREAQLNFPIWLGATTADLASLGLSNALPGTVILDRQGKIVTVINGPTTAKQLQPLIDKLLAEPVATLPPAVIPNATSTSIIAPDSSTAPDSLAPNVPTPNASTDAATNAATNLSTSATTSSAAEINPSALSASAAPATSAAPAISKASQPTPRTTVSSSVPS
jgi:peroxiredoxin